MTAARHKERVREAPLSGGARGGHTWEGAPRTPATRGATPGPVSPPPSRAWPQLDAVTTTSFLLGGELLGVEAVSATLHGAQHGAAARGTEPVGELRKEYGGSGVMADGLRAGESPWGILLNHSSSRFGCVLDCMFRADGSVLASSGEPWVSGRRVQKAVAGI